MTAPRALEVACVGFVFDPLAAEIIRRAAPPGMRLAFAESWEALADGALARADALLTVARVTDETLAAAPRLRFIQKWGSGYEKIDTAAAARRGIGVAITAGANAATIAEHALTLMLATLRRAAYADREMRAGRWDPAALRPITGRLGGRTVGIVGFGAIGREVARLVRAFGAEAIYHRPSGPATEGEAPSARYADLPGLLAASDVVTLHCPGGPATAGLIGAAEIARMKPGAILVNTARGSLVDEPALIAALKSGRIAGAGLDVFAEEPLPPDSPLRGIETVVMTPHSAGGALDDVAPMAARAFDNLTRVFAGQPLAPADVIVPAPLIRAAAEEDTA